MGRLLVLCLWGDIMRALGGVAIACVAVFAAGCSWIPNLNEVTGTHEEPRIFVDEVVKRIKCEIYEASQVVAADKLAWTKDWTAKANLTLSVLNSGGLTPNVSAVSYLPSAYYNAKNAAGGTLLSAVQQKFMLGANLTLSESATRTELVVFTVPFGNAKKENSCEGAAAGSELQGDLGIKEWVRTAFEPAKVGLLPPNVEAPQGAVPGLEDLPNGFCSLNPGLNAGIPIDTDAVVSDACREYSVVTRTENDDGKTNPLALAIMWRGIEPLNDVCVDNFFLKLQGHETIPNEGSKPSLSGSKLYPNVKQTGKIGTVKADVKKNGMFNWGPVQAHYEGLKALPNPGCRDIDALAKIMGATARLKDALKTIGTNYTSASQAGKKAQSFAKFLDSKTLKPLEEAENGLNVLNGVITGVPSPKQNVRDLQIAFHTFQLKVDLASSYDTLPKGIAGCNVDIVPEDKRKDCYLQYINLVKAASFVVYVENLENTSTEISKYITSFSPSLPIDSLSHTIIFVVTYGAGITPQWGLINVSTANNPLAMTQGMRTHNLLLSIGPPNENTANIQNQTVANALAPH
jgi:hypothetical protein